MKRSGKFLFSFITVILVSNSAWTQNPPPSGLNNQPTNSVARRSGGGSRVPADKPAPRTDKNSQIAHEQLVDKAKKGGIDIYFVGDSITRRWGTSDRMYREMLENW